VLRVEGSALKTRPIRIPKSKIQNQVHLSSVFCHPLIKDDKTRHWWYPVRENERTLLEFKNLNTKYIRRLLVCQGSKIGTNL